MVHQLWGQRTAGNLLPGTLPHHVQHRMILAPGQGCRSKFVPNARRTVRGSAPPARGHRLHGLARHILAQPGIEGDPLAFLDITDKYWQALRNQKHEPEKKGPTVVTYADGPLFPDRGTATTANGNGKGAANGTSSAGASAASVHTSPHDYDGEQLLCVQGPAVSDRRSANRQRAEDPSPPPPTPRMAASPTRDWRNIKQRFAALCMCFQGCSIQPWFFPPQYGPHSC